MSFDPNESDGINPLCWLFLGAKKRPQELGQSVSNKDDVNGIFQEDGHIQFFCLFVRLSVCVGIENSLTSRDSANVSLFTETVVCRVLAGPTKMTIEGQHRDTLSCIRIRD